MTLKNSTVDFIKRFLKCFKDLHATEDTLSFMIRGHLHCEAILTEILSNAVIRPSALNIDRLNYQAKLNLCNAFALIPESLVPSLSKLGNLRNRLAHNIDYSITEKDQSDLMNVILSNAGEHIRYYLSKRTEFPNGLKRSILGLIMDLSVNAVTAKEDKEEMLINLVLVLQKMSGMSMESFVAYSQKELDEFDSKEKMHNNRLHMDA